MRDAITDVAGIRVGHWTDRRAATGCTVVLCEEGAVGGVDVRGGAPGSRETELLRPGATVQFVHAVLLTGGTAYGLDAAAGVMRYLEERGKGFPLLDTVVPLVAGGVILDVGIGRNDVRPDADAGYRACVAARGGRVPEGSVGAGTGATVAKALGADRRLKGGVGTASERLATGVVVGALAVTNSLGEIVDPDTGEVVAGPGGPRRRFLDSVEILRERGAPPWSSSNTTLVALATNARLSKEQACRLATAGQAGIARAVRPSQTAVDGDTVFTLATGEAPLPPEWVLGLEAIAARAVERAIVRGVMTATGLAGVPSAREWKSGRTRR